MKSIAGTKGLQQNNIYPLAAENESHLMSSPDFSRDGRLAVCLHKANDNIHIYDFSSKILTRATLEWGDERSPTYSPSKAWTVFSRLAVKACRFSALPDPDHRRLCTGE